MSILHVVREDIKDEVGAFIVQNAHYVPEWELPRIVASKGCLWGITFKWKSIKAIKYNMK